MPPVGAVIGAGGISAFPCRPGSDVLQCYGLLVLLAVVDHDAPDNQHREKRAADHQSDMKIFFRMVGILSQ